MCLVYIEMNPLKDIISVIHLTKSIVQKMDAKQAKLNEMIRGDQLPAVILGMQTKQTL